MTWGFSISAKNPQRMVGGGVGEIEMVAVYRVYRDIWLMFITGLLSKRVLI